MPPETYFFDKNDTRLFENDRVALNYDDELVAGTLTFQGRMPGVPEVRFDRPTNSRSVTSVRLLNYGLVRQLGLVLAFRADFTENTETLGGQVESMQACDNADYAMASCDGTPGLAARPEFLLKVSEIRDTENGMSISLTGKEAFSHLGRSHVTLSSEDKSAFDGLGPGDRVLVTLTPVIFLPSQDPESHELSI